MRARFFTEKRFFIFEKTHVGVGFSVPVFKKIRGLFLPNQWPY